MAFVYKTVEPGYSIPISEKVSSFSPEEEKLYSMMVELGQSHLFDAWPALGEKEVEKHAFFKQVRRRKMRRRRRRSGNSGGGGGGVVVVVVVVVVALVGVYTTTLPPLLTLPSTTPPPPSSVSSIK